MPVNDDDEEEEEDEDDYGSMKKSLHLSTPKTAAPVKFVYAMRGCREKEEIPAKKLSVTWSPELCDPNPFVETFVRIKKPRLKTDNKKIQEFKKNEKPIGKDKGKASKGIKDDKKSKYSNHSRRSYHPVDYVNFFIAFFCRQVVIACQLLILFTGSPTGTGKVCHLFLKYTSTVKAIPLTWRANSGGGGADRVDKNKRGDLDHQIESVESRLQELKSKLEALNLEQARAIQSPNTPPNIN